MARSYSPATMLQDRSIVWVAYDDGSIARTTDGKMIAAASWIIAARERTAAESQKRIKR